MRSAHDIRFALREIRRTPGFSAVLILILGLGIGANTAMFTLVNGILLKPLPCPDGHRIMHLGTSNLEHGIASQPVSYPDFADWKSQSQSFSEMALIGNISVRISDGISAAEPVEATRMTANAFRALRLAPVLGRDFRPGEDQPGAPRVAILGHGLWLRRYGGNPSILGAAISVEGEPVSIIGVMASGMRFPASTELWLPLVSSPEHERRDARRFFGIARLRDGASLDDARRDLDLIGRRLESEFPASNLGVRPVVTPYTEQAVGRDIRFVLLALQGAVLFLLLIVCANAANLLLSRCLRRGHEVAIRAALGAGRGVLIRQLLTESVVHSLAGGIAGLAFAGWGIHVFDLATAGANRPYWLTFEMDYRVFAFVAGLVLVTAVLFGLAPAIHLARAGVSDQLKQGGRAGAGRKPLRLASCFVAAQLACTVILLVSIGLLARSILNIYRQATGFDAEPVLTMRLRLSPAAYARPPALARFQTGLLAAVQNVPGVDTASIASHLPLGGSSLTPLEVEGHPLPPDGKAAPAATLSSSPEYFRTFGIRITAGRAFNDTDGDPGHENAIVNQSFAARFWPGAQALEKRVRIPVGEDHRWLTIVGVSADVRQNQASARELAPVLYLPARLSPQREFWLTVRGVAPPGTLASAVVAAIRKMDPDVPVSSIMTMAEVLRRARWPHRVFGSMFATFGIVAAILAGLGVYSVVAYSVALRTREIGVRMALGATTGRVGWMIVRRGMRPAVLGVAAGLCGALVLTRCLRALLIEVSASDPLTFAAVAAFQTALALLACWIPANRAARVDPVTALRQS